MRQCLYLPSSKKGLVAERLGSGLQHHVQRFESAPNLDKKPSVLLEAFFMLVFLKTPSPLRTFGLLFALGSTKHHPKTAKTKSLLIFPFPIQTS